MGEDTRRQFLVQSMTGVSAGWLAASWPQLVAAAESVQTSGRFGFFDARQAGEIDAMAAQIFPTTDTPGAREAKAVYFIDLALMSFARNQQAVVTSGFGELDAKRNAMFPGTASFAGLAPAQQIQILTAIETTPFFRAVRDLTVMGLFAAPQHGGNFNKVGWKLVDFDNSLNFQAPFGAYDR